MKQIDDLMPLVTYSRTRKVLPILQINQLFLNGFRFAVYIIMRAPQKWYNTNKSNSSFPPL